MYLNSTQQQQQQKTIIQGRFVSCPPDKTIGSRSTFLLQTNSMAFKEISDLFNPQTCLGLPGYLVTNLLQAMLLLKNKKETPKNTLRKKCKTR